MARSSQYWVVLLVLLFAAAATASLVSSEEPNIAEQTQVTQDEVEAAPTYAEKIEATKDLGKKQAAQAGEAVKTWKDWATKQAGEWTGKGQAAAGDATESAKAYATQSAESASGAFSKWSNWAKETAGKFAPKKNPAAEAVEYINKHTTGATDEEL